MAIQTKILTRKISETLADGKVITGSFGTLAIGKVGDVVSRAYGPVARPYTLTEEKAFGSYIEGKGILVNPGDCAGFSTVMSVPFDTKTLKAGQVGTVLVSGACVIKRSQYGVIAAAMNIQDTFGREHEFDAEEWAEIAEFSDEKDYKKDDLVVYSGAVYKAKADTTAATWNPDKFTAVIANEYNKTSDYEVGACVSFGGKFYVCTVAIEDVMEVEVNGFKAA